MTQFVRHWIEIHAPLAHAVPGVRRYVQNHIQRRAAPGPTSRPPMSRSTASPSCGSTICAAMQRANASPEAKRLHDDGALFIGGIKTFIIEEKVIIPISE